MFCASGNVGYGGKVDTGSLLKEEEDDAAEEEEDEEEEEQQQQVPGKTRRDLRAINKQ